MHILLVNFTVSRYLEEGEIVCKVTSSNISSCDIVLSERVWEYW